VLQLLLNGVAIGCIYALAACGFVWVYQAVGAVNFAHGEMVMVGAYLGVTGAVLLGWPPALSLVAAVAASAVLGLGFQRVAFAPVQARPPITFIIVSIGMSILMRNGALALWGPDPVAPPDLLGGRMIRLGGTVVSAHHLLIIAVTLSVFALQALFFARTRLGRRLRATAEDGETARLMGVNVGAMIALTFAMAAALAALAGTLVAPVIFVSPELGLFIILKAFIASVIGGFASIPGTLVGGVLLGVIEVLTAGYVSSVYKDVVAFLLLVVVLLVLPRGLFGERTGERA
jgi:branched-chain amino acid transport system permease protein